MRVVPYDSAAVILVENGIIRNRRLRGYDRYGAAEFLQKLELPVEQVPNLDQIARTREPYFVADTRSYPGWLRIEGLGHVRSWVGAPISIRGNLLGFLSLDKAESGFYSAEMAERLGAFAIQAAIAFENARLYAEQQRLAMTDSLTGLFNRRYCLELAEREYQRARRHKTPLCILMVDIDHFKQVNDRIGHATGDSALHKVARELAASVRAIDIVARYGGDEFLVLLPDCGERDAHRIASRMNERVSIQTVKTEQGEIQLSVSVGVASIALVGEETLDQLIARADAEMYRVKHPPAKDASAAN